MADGHLAPTLAQFWPDPVVLWATPEKPAGSMVSSCSLVGTHCWASILRQMGHTFELIYGEPSKKNLKRQLNKAIRIVSTARHLRSMRLGMVGGQAPGFLAMSEDQFVMHSQMGIQVQKFSLIEFSNIFNNIDNENISEDVLEVKRMKLPYKDVDDSVLPVASQLYLTMHFLLDNENLDALTIREWPEMPNVFGQWPYLGIARLNEKGIPVSVEGDADGAITSWIIESLGLGRSYLSDWLEHDEKTITLWHVGAAPVSLCRPIGEEGGPQIARHFNNKKPTVVEATIREDTPVTVARCWRLDGQYYLTAREGQTILPRRHLMATNGLVKLDDQNPGAWLDKVSHKGMPHHVVMFQGHHKDILKKFACIMEMYFI